MTGTLKGLGSRAIIGAFFKRLEEVTAASWIGSIATPFTSNQESETYTFLGDAPTMKEKVSNYTKEGLRRYEFTLKNKRFGAGLEIDEDDWRRDKTSQIMVRVNELAVRAAQLPQKLISDLINANGNAYDGAAFFHDSSHVTASGAVVDNIVTQTAATGTSPTIAEATDGLLAAIQQMLGFKDDAGEPRNEFAQRFVVMCPPVMWAAIVGAIRNDFTSNGATNTLRNSGFQIDPVMNPRLTSTDSVFLFRADSDVKPFVWQDEVPTELRPLVEGSDYHTLNDARLYFAKRVCNAGYGRFDQAVKLQFT
jgi:phage major head subunit gpT-like protein